MEIQKSELDKVFENSKNHSFTVLVGEESNRFLNELVSCAIKTGRYNAECSSFGSWNFDEVNSCLLDCIKYLPKENLEVFEDLIHIVLGEKFITTRLLYRDYDILKRYSIYICLEIAQNIDMDIFLIEDFGFSFSPEQIEKIIKRLKGGRTKIITTSRNPIFMNLIPDEDQKNIFYVRQENDNLFLSQPFKELPEEFNFGVLGAGECYLQDGERRINYIMHNKQYAK